MAAVSQALRLVFAKPGYLLLAAGSAIAAFVFATWLPNIGLVWEIVTSSTIPLSGKAAVLMALVASIATNFTNFSASITVLTSLLFGTNVAVVAYLVRAKRATSGYYWRASGATSLGGLTSGFFGSDAPLAEPSVSLRLSRSSAPAASSRCCRSAVKSSA